MANVRKPKNHLYLQENSVRYTQRTPVEKPFPVWGIFTTFLILCCFFAASIIVWKLFTTNPPEAVPDDTLPDAPSAEVSDDIATTPVLTAESWAEQTIQAFAQEQNIPVEAYPEALVAMLERNPETEDFVLNYPLEHSLIQEVNLLEYANSQTVPLFMQWDQRWGYLEYSGELAGLSACGPVCLSMVVCYLTGDYSKSPDVMIQYAIDNGYCAPESGSYWSLISEGGSAFGLDVTEFLPDKARIFANLEVGNPIICIMGPGDFTSSGHFIVLRGLENGLIQVNDPNSYSNSSQLWDYDAIAEQILNVWVFRNEN